MKVEQRTHPGYEEWVNASKSIRQCFGQYQYIYSSEKGKISLVQCLTPSPYLEWEIYCLEGNLFEDVERFGVSKEDAEKRIKELLK